VRQHESRSSRRGVGGNLEGRAGLSDAYARDYHELDPARREYAALTRDGTSCVGCGDCLPTCTQEIDIAAKLKDVHRLLG
jgi:predicted aldo/keto reductase-like oxidoreductase